MKKSVIIIFIITLSVFSFSHVPFFLNEEVFSDETYFVEDVDLSQIYYYDFDKKSLPASYSPQLYILVNKVGLLADKPTFTFQLVLS